MTPKLDRRIRRTRRRLREALMDLVVEKGYDPITVQDITERADVARTTFYKHYRGKDDLLMNMMEDVFTEIIDQIPPVDIATVVQTYAETGQSIDGGIDFHHIAQHADFYRVMFGENGSPKFVNYLRKRLQQIAMNQFSQLSQPKSSRLPADFIISYLVGAMIGVYIWWLEDHPELSPEDVDALSTAMAFKGVAWAYGLDEGLRPQHDQD